MLLIVVLSLDGQERFKWFTMPSYAYLSLIYLRVFLSISSLFIGLHLIVSKKEIKNLVIGKYLIVFIGILFTMLSVMPSITSILFSKGIDMTYLDTENKNILTHNINAQKSYLINVLLIFLGYSVALAFIFKNKKTHNKSLERDA